MEVSEEKNCYSHSLKIPNSQMNHAALFCVALLAFVLGWWPQRRKEWEWDGFSLCTQMIAAALPIEYELLDLFNQSVRRSP